MPSCRVIHRRVLAALSVLALSLPCARALPALQAATATDSTPRRFTPEDILALRGVGDAQLSPDGQWIAYVVTETEFDKNARNSDLWLVRTSGGEPFRLTRGPKADGQPRWSPDGKWIAFISDREERAQVWRIAPFGGEAERLTDSKTPVNGLEWSPDGRRIAYTAPQAPTPEQERKQKDRDDAIVVDGEFRMGRIWVLDVATRAAKEVVAGDFHATDPQWSPDGTRIAFTTTPTPKPDDGRLSDVRVIDVAAGTMRTLVENAGPDQSPRWSPDGRLIALLTSAAVGGEVAQLQLAVVPAEGGTPRVVARDFVYQPGPATWSADGRALWFGASVRTTNQLFAVPAAGGTPQVLTDVAGVLSGVSVAGDGRTVAAIHSTMQRPPEVHVATRGRSDRPFGAFAARTAHNAAVARLAMGRSEVIRWRSADGMEIEGLLVYPVEYRPGRRYPTITWVHGGPSGVWTQGFPGSWGNYAHVWAGNGWVSFFPNVRGSSGYGEAFLRANIRDWGGGDFRDIQTGLDTLVARGIADPDRLAQSGWSYGGYMTAWTITQTSRFKAAMVGAGLTNMFSMYSTNDLQRTLDGYFGAEPWDDRQAYDRASAMQFIKQAKTPTLILHGQQDQRVPIGQAQELYQGLKRNEVPVELVFFPREGHGLSEPRHQLDRMKRELAWMTRWVLGPDVVP